MPEPPSITIRLVATLTAAVLLPVIMQAREAGGLPTGDPIAQREREVAAARGEADAAAARLQDALAEQVRLADEIARLEREIPVLRVRAASLRDQVRRRAAELYKGFDPHVMLASAEPDTAIDDARHAHLTEKVTEHDTRLAAELRATAKRLEVAEAELRVRKAQHDTAVVQMVEDRRRLDERLVRVQVVLDRLHALAAEGAFEGASGGLVESGAEVCPVDGAVAFTNDWGAPRSGGRTHEGTDVLAAHGTPLVAVTAGVVTDNSGGLGGIGVDLLGDDGVRYYYAHLSGVARTGRVSTGERIGYVGDTGNASGNPHLHFQMHPGGGAPVNPYATLKVLCG